MAASIDDDEVIQSAKEPPLLEPLTLDIRSPKSPASGKLQDDSHTSCLFCDKRFDISGDRDPYVGHMVQEHKMLIADFKLIPDFPKYIEYWRNRIRGKPLEEFCTVIRTNTKESDKATPEMYYMLCDVLPEDKELRKDLQQQKLLEVLEVHQREREEDASFSRMCLFCREQFNKYRADMFNHMASDHNFNIGHPDNIVYKDELLQLLQQKLDNMQCLHCEKTFKDRFVLKEHMRKKQHKQINPRNKMYDKFYIINYLELGKSWEEIQSEDDRETGDEADSSSGEWNDWQEETNENAAIAVCLFCQHSAHVNDVIPHMKDVHQFDVVSIRQKNKLTFYQQVKLINFIRRQVHLHTCIACDERHDTSDALMLHLFKSGHTHVLPPSENWDQPQYFFPTFENDNLLCGLDGEEDLDQELSEVVAEDLHLKDVNARKQEIIQLLS